MRDGTGKRMTITTCICLKFGTRYGPEYVNRLRGGLARHTTSRLRFLCMTDDAKGLDAGVEVLPLPQEPFHDRMFAAMRAKGLKAPFQKISLFRPGLVDGLEGPLLVLDIDVAITGNVDAIRDFAPGRVAMRREWHARSGLPALGHGSVEKIEPDRHRYLYDRMAANPEEALVYGGGSEQIYTSRLAMDHGDFVTLPEAWVVSFKYDCRPAKPLNLILAPRLPADARVVCFHGRPKMEEAVQGYRAGLSSTRPAAWLRDAWLGDAA